jgi:hypothetical protein
MNRGTQIVPETGQRQGVRSYRATGLCGSFEHLHFKTRPSQHDRRSETIGSTPDNDRPLLI